MTVDRIVISLLGLAESRIGSSSKVILHLRRIVSEASSPSSMSACGPGFVLEMFLDPLLRCYALPWLDSLDGCLSFIFVKDRLVIEVASMTKDVCPVSRSFCKSDVASRHFVRTCFIHC